MRTKGTGPQGLGVGSPFKKKGPCGGPNQPSCKDELKRMAKSMKYNESYREEMSVSDTGSMRDYYKGGKFMNPKNVNNSAKAVTTKRVNELTNRPEYKALTKNKAARPIVGRADQFVRKAKTRGSSRYQVPSVKEVESLLEIGGKYVGSKDLSKDITFLDKTKALYHGWKIASKYPNLKKYATKGR